MFFPKAPIMERPVTIYKGFVETGPGQFPIKKTPDWVEDLGPFSAKMGYAAKNGFQISAAFALIDITTISKIVERRAQIARFVYFTVPVTSIAAGWMGGVEVAKIALGKENSVYAHALGATVPGGIYSIWMRSGLAGGIIATIPFALLGMSYSYAVKHNLYYSIFDPQHGSNPNRPTGYGYKNWSFFGNVERSEHGHAPWFGGTDPGPNWKKWEKED